MEDHSQADLIRHNYEFLYGDPPRHSEGTYLHENAKITCVAGDSMNTMAVRVLEYWKRDRWEWVRDPSLEITIESDELDRIKRGQWQAPPISVPSDTPAASHRKSFRPHTSGRNILGTLARWISRS